VDLRIGEGVVVAEVLIAGFDWWHTSQDANFEFMAGHLGAGEGMGRCSNEAGWRAAGVEDLVAGLLFGPDVDERAGFGRLQDLLYSGPVVDYAVSEFIGCLTDVHKITPAPYGVDQVADGAGDRFTYLVDGVFVDLEVSLDVGAKAAPTSALAIRATVVSFDEIFGLHELGLQV